MDAEQQDQQRRHQRAAADAGHPDQQADAKSRRNVERINHFPGASSIRMVRTYINAGDKRPIDGSGSGEIRIFHARNVVWRLFSPIFRFRAKSVSWYADSDGRFAEPTIDLAHRPSRRVSNVQDIDRVFAHAIENPERIAHDGCDTDLRSLRDSRTRLRDAANAVDDIFQPSSDQVSYRRACASSVMGRNSIKISERSSRKDELHA